MTTPPSAAAGAGRSPITAMTCSDGASQTHMPRASPLATATATAHPAGPVSRAGPKAREAPMSGQADQRPPQTGMAGSGRPETRPRAEARREMEARAALMRAADVGDVTMGSLVAEYGAPQAVEAIRARTLPPEFVAGQAQQERPPNLTSRLNAWFTRLAAANPAADIEAGQRSGARLIIFPGRLLCCARSCCLGAGPALRSPTGPCESSNRFL
jgi:hypothetical protein